LRLAIFDSSGPQRADMTIATKSGSLIVKDGKFAESCACCGAGSCSADYSTVDEVLVEIEATNYLDFITKEGGALGASKETLSYVFFLQSMNGTHSLSKIAGPVGIGFGNRIGSVWSIDLPGNSGCNPSTLTVTIAHGTAAGIVFGNRLLETSFTARGQQIQESNGGTRITSCPVPILYPGIASRACETAAFTPPFCRGASQRSDAKEGPFVFCDGQVVRWQAGNGSFFLTGQRFTYSPPAPTFSTDEKNPETVTRDTTPGQLFINRIALANPALVLDYRS